jgi:RND family efflux transporter MFP subunit
MRSTIVFFLFLAASIAAFGWWRSVLHRRRTHERVVLDGSIRDSASPEPATAGYFGIVLPAESAAIEPYVAGRVERVFVKPGDHLAKGDRIALLDSRSLEHELAAARAVYAGAASRLARRQALAKEPGSAPAAMSAISTDELEAARFEAAKQLAAVSALARSLADTRVTAPFDGMVAEQYLYPGAVAGPGHPILRLVGRGLLRMRFAVPGDEASKIAVGTPVRIELGSPPVRIPASVIGVAPQVDTASGMVFAVANLPVPPDFEKPFMAGTPARVVAGFERPHAPAEGTAHADAAEPSLP